MNQTISEKKGDDPYVLWPFSLQVKAVAIMCGCGISVWSVAFERKVIKVIYYNQIS